MSPSAGSAAVLRPAIERDAELDVVAANDADSLTHLLMVDSVYGR